MPAPDMEHEVVPGASVNVKFILVVVTDVIKGAVNAGGLVVVADTLVIPVTYVADPTKGS